jgi:hypothetical protein
VRERAVKSFGDYLVEARALREMFSSSLGVALRLNDGFTRSEVAVGVGRRVGVDGLDYVFSSHSLLHVSKPQIEPKQRCLCWD